MDFIINGWQDYELIDSGKGRKLERFGQYILNRPAPQALWDQEFEPEVWKQAQAVYHRSSSGGGDWEYVKAIPEKWNIQWQDLTFILKTTGFGHVGIFPEQRSCWEWIIKQCSGTKNSLNVLNLFAYSGGSSLVAAKCGAKVCHVDGSKGIVSWAAENAQLNFNTSPIRWIVDDVIRFVRREVKRGVKYNGIILDPPSFGRGPKGQVWKLDQHLSDLTDLFGQLLDPNPGFLLMTCHSPNLNPAGLTNILRNIFHQRQGTIQSGQMLIHPAKSENLLPSGIYGCWTNIVHS